MVARQNKWHAGRYGIDATFVDPDTMQAVTSKDSARRLIEICTPYAKKLDCLTELGYLQDIIDNGTGAKRQLEVFRQTGDMKEVVRFLAEQAEKEPLAR
jgi:carboxylate-amine ligase